VRPSDEIVFIGLSITSSWGNGHASTYRSLIRGLHGCGHRVLFLEQDQPWYASNRDTSILRYCKARLYEDFEELCERHTQRIRAASVVVVGSQVKDGRQVCEWVLERAPGVKVFYDLDTPKTLVQLGEDRCQYLARSQVPEFDLMLSSAGGPTLQRLREEFGARHARTLYCSVDVDQHRPTQHVRDISLGYLGTYSEDRQPGLEQLLNAPARALPKQRFAVVGARYPGHLQWPRNVQRLEHVGLDAHADFFGRLRFTLNLTRTDMRCAGYSPSVRLFEAAACGTPIISDEWPGLDEFFTPGEEILLAHDREDVVRVLSDVDECQARRIADAARERTCAEHSSAQRALEFEQHLSSAGSACDPIRTPKISMDLRAATMRGQSHM
jgi:spore maturation protein CgeB